MRINPFLTCVNIKPSPFVKCSTLTFRIPSHPRPTLETAKLARSPHASCYSISASAPAPPRPARARSRRGSPGLSRRPRHPHRGTAGPPPAGARPHPRPLPSPPSLPAPAGRGHHVPPAAAAEMRAGGRAPPRRSGQRQHGGAGEAAAQPGRGRWPNPRCFGAHLQLKEGNASNSVIVNSHKEPLGLAQSVAN